LRHSSVPRIIPKKNKKSGPFAGTAINIFSINID